MSDVDLDKGTLVLVDSSSAVPANPLFVDAASSLQEPGGWRFTWIDEAGVTATSSGLARCAGRVRHRLGLRGGRSRELNQEVARHCRMTGGDLLLVVGGSNVSRTTVENACDEGVTTAVFLTDDPFRSTPRSNRRLRDALGAYDFVFSSKLAALHDLIPRTKRPPTFVRFAYNPLEHFVENPRVDTKAVCDISFIGGADPHRIAFLEDFVRAIPSVRLRLFGGYWHTVPSLRRFASGFVRGTAMRAAIQNSIVNVNFVRQVNRDDHVMRTFEIPACGGLMALEPTPTHLEMFTNGQDAMYFEAPEDLVRVVKQCSSDPDYSAEIAGNGFRRVTLGNNTYRDRLVEMLQMMTASPDREVRGAQGAQVPWIRS